MNVLSRVISIFLLCIISLAMGLTMAFSQPPPPQLPFNANAFRTNMMVTDSAGATIRYRFSSYYTNSRIVYNVPSGNMRIQVDGQTWDIPISDTIRAAADIWNRRFGNFPGNPQLVPVSRTDPTANFTVERVALRQGLTAQGIPARIQDVTRPNNYRFNTEVGILRITTRLIITRSRLNQNFTTPNNGRLIARWVATLALTHEIGHTLGLLHPFNNIMTDSPRDIDPSFLGLAQNFNQEDFQHAAPIMSSSPAVYLVIHRFLNNNALVDPTRYAEPSNPEITSLLTANSTCSSSQSSQMKVTQNSASKCPLYLTFDNLTMAAIIATLPR